jgi:hypothetical protein
MKQYTLLDGFNVVLALTAIIIAIVFNYGTASKIINITIAISLLSSVFITNKKVRIFISVACLSALFYSYFQFK